MPFEDYYPQSEYTPPVDMAGGLYGRVPGGVAEFPPMPPTDVIYQRFTNFHIPNVGVVVNLSIPLLTTVTPCDCIVIQNSIGSLGSVFVNDGASGRNAGLELSPGQTMVVEVDNSRGLLNSLLPFIGGIHRNELDASKFTVSAAALCTVNVMLFFQSAEGY